MQLPFGFNESVSGEKKSLARFVDRRSSTACLRRERPGDSIVRRAHACGKARDASRHESSD